MAKITVDTAAIDAGLDSMLGRVNDMSDLFERIRDDYYVLEIMEIFATDGRGTWAPTQRTNPILRDSLDMYNSLTDITDPNFIELITPTTLTLDTAVWYQNLHEFGWDEYTVPFPPRPIFALLDPNSPAQEAVIEVWAEDVIIQSGLRDFL